MRRRAPQLFAVAAVCSFVRIIGYGQVTMLPTPPPIVTAENESWFLAGEPVLYAGSVYYPTGPLVYFNPNEMVRSGDYLGIPLYTRTTLEPYSLVFVPAGGGLMKPYERRRAGDIAGTVGSTLPSFPVVSPYDRQAEVSAIAGLIRAPAPPMQVAPIMGTAYPVPERGAIQPPFEPVATAGAPYPPPGPLVSARLPEGLDAIFVDYSERRWFNKGHAVELDPAAFTRIGEYHGFAVYRRGEDDQTIYITVSRGARDLVAPYSINR
jgi:hypothetical protein